MAWPVTESLATQNQTAPATSSGVISRPMGCLASSAERAWSLVRPVLVTMFPIVAAVIGVSTKPGLKKELRAQLEALDRHLRA